MYFRKDLILFAYLHLAAAGDLVFQLMDSGVHAVAYETIQLPDGSLPLLMPMSEVAGRMSVQTWHSLSGKTVWKRHLVGRCAGRQTGTCSHHWRWHRRHQCGQNGPWLAGPGHHSGKFSKTSRNWKTLLRSRTSAHVQSAQHRRSGERSRSADWRRPHSGARAPKLVTADMVQQMQPKSVIVDVAVDQGRYRNRSSGDDRRRTGI